MRSKSILSGVNVPIEPTSNSDNRVTNNIKIDLTRTASSADLEPPTVTVDDKPSYPSVSPYADIQLQYPAAASAFKPEGTVDEYLLQLYQTILLNDNKKLLYNVISNNKIILSKKDLEQIVSRKVGLEARVDVEDPEVECCRQALLAKVSSIAVNTASGWVNFKIEFNKDYCELVEKYRIGMKWVLA